MPSVWGMTLPRLSSRFRRNVMMHEDTTAREATEMVARQSYGKLVALLSSRTRNLAVVLFCPIERAGQDLSVALEQIASRLTLYCRARVIAVRVVR